IASGCGLSSAERLFVLGLLADLGHLAMYQTIPDLAREAEREAERLDLPVAEVERRLIGCDYAEVSAALADHWKLPPSFAATLGAQLDPRLGGEHCFDAAIVHVATQLARADRCGESSERAAAWVSATAWQQLAMSPASLQRVREEAELNLAAYLALFFPRLGTA
ncbi:MAG TPA: HDOD domain-containing protein, partial [Pseudothauera hydrothermalis]|nr:HDOD domain-containing protein [Pseudothauera hydrothermalis]